MNCSAKMRLSAMVLIVGMAYSARGDEQPPAAAQPPDVQPAQDLPDQPAKAKRLEEKPDAEKGGPAQPEGELLPWIAGLDAGQREALERRRPMVVLVGGEACPWCDKLDEEIAKTDAQKALSDWTLVRISIDKAPGDAQRLGVTGVPALRLRTITGRPVASHDGFLPADQLVAWLAENRQAAVDAPDAVLLASGPPGAMDIVKLTRQFSHRSAAVRQAAIGRLVPHANLAGSTVVRSFQRGNLATRLTALELLEQWEAPVDEFDPWDAETLTDEKLATLQKWAQETVDAEVTAEGTDADAAVVLDDVQLADVRRQLDRMVKVDAAEAAAIREQLGRLREAIRDEVLGRLKQATNDSHVERLRALRYRLVASDTLSLRWPGGLIRLASKDIQQRHHASEELVALATLADQELLLELFSDPDPLVREITLRGLQRLSEGAAVEALVRLLKDPEPNVRAAVLKQFAENPNRSLVPAVAEYVATEKDADLVVHAIRFFREAGSARAIDAMLTLLKHDSWRVRAEAAEGIGQALGGDVSAPMKKKATLATAALIDDEDAFVVSRALKQMSAPKSKQAVERLAKAAQRHPDLVVQVVELMAESGEQSQDHLREFFRHAQPNVRCAAVRGLSTSLGEGASDVLLTALSDKNEDVRITAAQSVLQQLQGVRPDEDDLLRRAGKLPASNVYIDPSPSLGERLFDWFRKGAKAKAEKEQGEATPEQQPPKEKVDPLEAEFDDLELELNPEDRPPRKAPDAGDTTQEESAETAVSDTSARPSTSQTAALPPRKEMQVVGPPEKVGRAATEAEAAREEAIAAVREAAAAAREAARETAEEAPPFLAAPLPDLDVDVPPPVDAVDDDGESLWDGWLVEFRTGKGRPAWMDQFVPPLMEMLDAASPRERCAAAVTLIALGKPEIGVPALTEAVHEERELAYPAGDALKWLVWEERIALFKRLRGLAVGNDPIRRLLYEMREVPDRRAAPVFWEMLADEQIDDSVAQAVQGVIISSYSGRQYADLDGASKSTKKEILDTAQPRATSGPEHQRLAAMGMLTYVDKEAAAVAARANLTDAKSGAQLRRDSLQLLLGVLAPREATKMAIDNLRSAVQDRRDTALHYLAFGNQDWYDLRGFSYNRSYRTVSFGSGESAPKVKAPEGLEREHLVPLLQVKDKEVAAQAGYLLALLGSDAGLPVLIEQWRQHHLEEDAWKSLVYRAIAVLDDGRHIDVLRDIYGSLDQWEMREFYWTIRSMTGSEILKLRKKIRDEVGMDNLK